MNVKVADASEVKQTFSVSLEGRRVLIVRTPRGLFAVEDSCPHAQQSLSSGTLDGAILTCRHHGVKIDLGSGRVVDGMGFLGLQPVAVFPVEEVDGAIWVDIPDSGGVM